MATWTNSLKFKGVRWRVHATRKHGVQPDKYFAIRYQLGGKRREEALGWSSEGWTEAKAGLELEKLKAAAKTGEGPSRLQEKRAIAEEKRQADDARKAREALAALTLGEFYQKHYLPQAETDKSRASCKAEASL